MIEVGVLRDDNITDDVETIDRVVVRAIIRKKDKYLMIFSDTYDNYFFPGGGLLPYENNIKGLKREVLEETGMKVDRVFKTFGYIDEIKKHKFKNNYFKQRTFYYFCNTNGFGVKKLEKHEKNYKVKWISLDDALEANEKVLNKPLFVIREIMIIKKLKEEIANERFRGNKQI